MNPATDPLSAMDVIGKTIGRRLNEGEIARAMHDSTLDEAHHTKYNAAVNRHADHIPDVTREQLRAFAAGGGLMRSSPRHGMAAVKQLLGQRARLQDFEELAPLPSGLLTVPRLFGEA